MWNLSGGKAAPKVEQGVIAHPLQDDGGEEEHSHTECIVSSVASTPAHSNPFLSPNKPEVKQTKVGTSAGSLVAKV